METSIRNAFECIFKKPLNSFVNASTAEKGKVHVCFNSTDLYNAGTGWTHRADHVNIGSGGRTMPL